MSEKRKWSKRQLILLICILGPLDTGLAWLLHAKGWVAIDFIFWPVFFLVVLLANEDSN